MPVLDESFAIRFFNEPTARRQRKIDCANHDVSADVACRRVDPTEIEPQPIVARFTVVVDPDTVTIDPDPPVFVEIAPDELAFSKPIQDGSISIKDVEPALDRSRCLLLSTHRLLQGATGLSRHPDRSRIRPRRAPVESATTG